MDNFLRLDDYVFEEILARIDDIRQLVSLRRLSHRWRRVIMSREFAVLFNNQEHPVPYQWLVSLGFTEEYPDPGILLCVEQSPERRHAWIPMDRVFGKDVMDLSLLAADGSLVLFKCFENGIPSLRVLNLFNMATRVVHVPVGIEGIYSMEFNNSERIRFQSKLDDGLLSFEISDVEFGERDLVPRHCLYVSVPPAKWEILKARPLNHGENFPAFHPSIGMMLFERNDAIKLSLDWVGAVFTRMRAHEVPGLVDQFLDGIDEDFGPVDDDGWEVDNEPILVPGRDGLAFQFQLATHPDAPGLGSLQGVRFLKISEDWLAYQRIASVPHHLIYDGVLDYNHCACIQETDGTINIAIIARDVKRGFCVIQYAYRNGDWVHNFYYIGHGIRFDEPVFTSGVTIGHMV